jgi:hypothetical protein
MLLCLGVVGAHNWLTSPARGNAGNNFNGWTSPPCPQKGERVHVQVAAGQRFPIEWASGHGYGSYTFFVVLDAKDESNMISHTLETLDEYLKQAPASALNYMADTWALHSNPPPATTPAASLVAAPVTSTWFPGGRPVAFRQYPGPVVVYNKTVAAVAADKRAKYKNNLMPWIISVHKFALHEDLPEQMDLAFLEIPAGSPSGQYVVQYLWNGYYDCVDVNVLAETSTDIFGVPSSDTSLDRIDHCLFNMTLNNFAIQSSCVELKQGEGPQGCIEACAKVNTPDYAACHGVQISPVVLPATAKFRGMYQSGTSHVPDQTKCAPAGFASTSSVCYPIRVGDTPIVGPPFKVTSDPEDPVFYSTCYRKKPGWAFQQACPACKPPVLKPTNKFGYTQQSCITCRDMYTNQSPLVTPFWVMDSTCFACDGTLG